MTHSLGVIGAGAWGTALAITAARAGNAVQLWAYEEEVCTAINKTHHNTVFLPDIPLSQDITATNDLATACDNKEALLIVAPSAFLRSMCEQLKALPLPAKIPLIICTKGIEQETGLLMSEVAEEILPKNPVLALSGPTFADEIAHDMPASAAIACTKKTFAKHYATALSTPHFHLLPTDDIAGVQVGGAIKNIIAIACGVAAGKNWGKNAQATLITAGLQEIHTLSRKKAGRLETILGPSGVGDLVLTCTSPKSRNMSLGIALGEGQQLETYLKSKRSVVEGMVAAQSINTLATTLNLRLPLCHAVYRVLYEKASIDEIINQC